VTAPSRAAATIAPALAPAATVATPAQAGVVTSASAAAGGGGLISSAGVTSAAVLTSTAGLTAAAGPVSSPTNCTSRKVAFNLASWPYLESLIFLLQKRKKYVNATCFPGESLDNGKVIGIIM
jgi:hypothetical protein